MSFEMARLDRSEVGQMIGEGQNADPALQVEEPSLAATRSSACSLQGEIRGNKGGEIGGNRGQTREIGDRPRFSTIKLSLSIAQNVVCPLFLRRCRWCMPSDLDFPRIAFAGQLPGVVQTYRDPAQFESPARIEAADPRRSARTSPYPRFGASQRSSSPFATPRRAAMSFNWSSPILPTTKYFDSGWAK